MSEELLNALMQLFAIIAKQNEGPSDKEREFVYNFLSKQLDHSSAKKYFNLFQKFAIKKNAQNRVSVMDSVNIIGIAKKINKILTQKQKIVVLIRIFELVKADASGLDLKYSIIKTLSDIFNISSFDFTLIESYILETNIDKIEKVDLLIIDGDNQLLKITQNDFDRSKLTSEGSVFILKIKSVDLFLFKAVGTINIKWNGLEIHNETCYVLAIGGVIQLNNGKPIFYQEIVTHFTPETAFPPLSFNINNIQYSFPNGNMALHEINISEGPGKLVGIMGASGSGKTTLLNIISGQQKPSLGEVLLNGINIHTESEKIKGVIGFVPQDDLLVEELTVFQNLFFNSKFCFADRSNKEIESRVLNLLDLLGLAEARDLKVGTVLNKVISGGQRKRLNIALELIREPSVLFLDEPTSGLSSKDSENIIKLLSQLALKGKLVFVVIHQPNSDIYKLLDKITLLDKGGYLIYYGNPIEAVSYFKKMDQWVNNEFGECPECGNINSESIFNIIEGETLNEFGSHTGARKVSAKEWFDLFKDKFSFQKKKDVTLAPSDSLQTPSKTKQLFIYLTRDFFSKISNKQYLLINLFEIPLLAFILSFIIRYVSNTAGTAYLFRENENIPAYIFMSIIVFSFTGISISAEEIFRDSKILKRENFLNLSRGSYLLSKVLLLFTLSALQSCLFVLIGNSIIGIHGMFLSYWLMLFSVSCCANLVGLNISSAFDSVITIYILIPLLLIPQMILGGAIFNYENLNEYIGGGNKVPLIAEFIPARWAYEGLMVDQFKKNEFEKIFYELEKKESAYNYKRGPYISQLLNVAEELDQLLDKKRTSIDELAIQDKIHLLQHEIKKERELNPTIHLEDTQNLSIEKPDHKIIVNIRKYLDELTSFYTANLNAIVAHKEMLLFKLQDSPDKLQAFRKKKNSYYNEYLSDVVKKTFSDKKLYESNNEITQIIDPVFNDPSTKSFFNFRTHFFAPSKSLFGGLIDTFTFNLLVMWCFIGTLYYLLYFNLLRKIINFKKHG